MATIRPTRSNSRAARTSLMDANALRPPLRDLFGEIPITERDLRLWLWSVPVWFNRHSRPARAAEYLRGYHVAEKIAREKAADRLQSIFGDETCPHCGALLESDQGARLDALERENAELRALLGRPRAAVVPLSVARTGSPAPARDSAHSRLPLPLRPIGRAAGSQNAHSA